MSVLHTNFDQYKCMFILQDKYSQNPKELIRIIKKCLESESLLAHQNNVNIINYVCAFNYNLSIYLN